MERLQILKIDSDACGVGYVDCRPILVNKTLPGEVVSITKLEKYPKYDIARQYKVEKQAKERINAICPYYDKCGGCNLQHVMDSYQKEFKIRKVKDAFKYVADMDLSIDNYYEGSLRFGYRNKIVFAVQNYECGMYINSTKDFVKIDNCLLIPKSLNRVYNLVANWIFDNKIQLNHIALRQVNNQFAIVLIGDNKPFVNVLIKMLDGVIPNRYQIIFNKNTSKKDIITNNLYHLHGSQIMDSKYGIEYVIEANSFLQVNDEVSSLLYDRVDHYINCDIVINAYSGAGLLSAILCKSAKNVYGIEIVKEAHNNAEQLKTNNNIHNLINICGRSEVELPKILTKYPQVSVVLDPPRKGVDNKLLNIVNTSTNIDKIVYISCSPNSLAKDIRLLNNYKIVRVELFDMFPNTSHVETLVLLTRKNVKDKI